MKTYKMIIAGILAATFMVLCGFSPVQAGTVYVMYETPGPIPCSGGYKLIRVEKRWEQERGGIFAWFNATVTTIQYYDYAENTYEMNVPIGGCIYRFYSLDKIKNIYEPSLENQMDII